MMDTLIKAAEVINGGALRPGPTNARFDALKISPHVADAENIWVKPVLGKSFYEALISGRSASASNYNPDLGTTAQAFPSSSAYENLWTDGGLMEYAAWAVIYEALPFIGLNTGAGGIFVNSSEYGEGQGKDGVKFLQDTYARRLREKRKVLEGYICTNSAALPAFQTSAVDYCNSCEDSTNTEEYLGLIFY